jgi:hypothetical protein
MMINSLEKMESIVDNNDSLRWDGWDVLTTKKSPTAWMKPEGIYKNGSWYLQQRFIVSEKGWEIPDKFVR